MDLKNIDFHYFTGTGNTLLVVRKMKEIFESKGIQVKLFPLEKTDPSKIDTTHTLGLAFPVAEQGTYPFVWDFIRAMPKASGTKVFMVDTMLAFSGGIVGPVRQILRKKGYTTVGALEICMPNNLFPTKINREKNRAVIEKGIGKAQRYAEEILTGKSKWGRYPLLSDFMGYFSQADWCWNFLRNHYLLKIDKEICSRCGICEKLCPVGNITMKGYPELKGKCTICMRCISFCPKNAIVRIRKKHLVYRAVKVKELLSA